MVISVFFPILAMGKISHYNTIKNSHCKWDIFCHHKIYPFSEVDALVNEVLNNGKVALSIEDYLVWTAKHKDLPGEFAKLIYQLCHIVLGLRPPNRQAEGRKVFILV